MRINKISKIILGLWLLFLIYPYAMRGQNFSLPIQEAIDSLIRFNSVPASQFIYPDSSTIILDMVASNDELLVLTDHKSPIVRTTSILILLNRKNTENVNFPLLFQKHYKDTTSIGLHIKEGGKYYYTRDRVNSIYSQMVGNYFGQISHRLASKKYNITPQEQSFMDSLMFCGKVFLIEGMSGLVFSSDPKIAFYEATRQKVIQQQDFNAMIYLAKFQKEEDIDLILENLPIQKSSGFTKWTPLSFFQHPRIFAYLASKVEENFKRFKYISQIAKYKNEEANILLNQIYSLLKKREKNSYKKSSILTQINHNYCESFADLYIDILEENEHFSNLQIPDSLWIHRGQAMYKFYKKWKINDNKKNKKVALKLYLQAKLYIETNYPDRVSGFILEQIEPGKNYGDFFPSFVYIYESKDPFFIDPLFDKMTEEPRPKYCYFISKILLDFNQEDIKRRIKKFYVDYPDRVPDIFSAEKGGLVFSGLLRKVSENKEKNNE